MSETSDSMPDIFIGEAADALHDIARLRGRSIKEGRSHALGDTLLPARAMVAGAGNALRELRFKAKLFGHMFKIGTKKSELIL